MKSYNFAMKTNINIIGFLLFCVFMIASCIIAEFNTSYSIYPGLNLFLILYIAFYLKTNGILTLKPEIIIVIMTFICFSCNYMLNRKYYIYPVSVYNKSAVYIGLCILGIIAGCNFPMRKSSETKIKCFKLYPSRSSILIICIFCLCITVLMQLLGYKTTHSAEMDKSNFMLDILFMIKTALQKIIYFDCFFYLIKGEKRKFWKEELIIVILNFGLSVLSGSRGSAILSLAVFPYIYVLYNKKIPIKFIIFSAIFLLMIVPFSIVYRDMDLFLSSSVDRGISAKLSAFSQAAKNVKFNSDTFDFVFRYVFGRFSRIEQSLRIINFMPEKIPYQNGTTIFPHIFISLIPGSILPNRPLTNIGKWFGINFKFTPAKNAVFITAGIMNEFYINFAMFGFLGCFVSGILIKKARHYWLVNKNYLFINIVYYDIFYSFAFMYNESYIVSGILTIFKSSVFLLFVLIAIYLLDRNIKSLDWSKNEK